MRKLFLLLATAIILIPQCAFVAVSDSSGQSLTARPAVSILGDSYSTYEGFVKPDSNICWYRRIPRTDRTDVNDVKQTWWHIFLSENDLRLEVNNSFSGSTISHQGYEGNDYRDRSFLTRLDNLGSPDMILMFGGTNDSWAGVECGNYDEKGDPYTFRPALAATFAGLRDHYPGTRIVCIVNDGLRDDITESLVNISKDYGVIWVVLDSIDKKQGHPTIKGMRQIADQITAGLKRESIP